MTKANRVKIPEEITSPSQLKWYCIRLRGGEFKQRLQPCRVLSKDEAMRHQRKPGGGNSKRISESQSMIQTIAFPNTNSGDFICVENHLLLPFNNIQGGADALNEDYLDRYMQQRRDDCAASDLEAEGIFLERIFDHAIKSEKESKDRASKERQDYLHDSSDDSCVMGRKRAEFEVVENSDSDGADDFGNEMDELDAPYTQAINFDPDNFPNIGDICNEPIRPGDEIEYYSPIFVSGDRRGLRQATVLSIDPKDEEAPLVLSNGECIPNDTKVKRIKVMTGGELLDHPGIFRPIYRFKLVKASGKGFVSAADGIMKEAAHFGDILQRNIANMKSKAQAEGFAPMDLLVNVKGKKSPSPMTKPTKETNKLPRKKERSMSFSSSTDSSTDESLGLSKLRKKSKPQTKESPDTNSRAKGKKLPSSTISRKPQSSKMPTKETNPSPRKKERSMSLSSSSDSSIGESLGLSELRKKLKYQTKDSPHTNSHNKSAPLAKNNKNKENKENLCSFSFAESPSKSHSKANSWDSSSSSSDGSVQLSPIRKSKHNTPVENERVSLNRRDVDITAINSGSTGLKVSRKSDLSISSDDGISSESSVEETKRLRLKKQSCVVGNVSKRSAAGLSSSQNSVNLDQQTTHNKCNEHKSHLRTVLHEEAASKKKARKILGMSLPHREASLPLPSSSPGNIHDYSPYSSGKRNDKPGNSSPEKSLGKRKSSMSSTSLSTSSSEDSLDLSKQSNAKLARKQRQTNKSGAHQPTSNIILNRLSSTESVEITEGCKLDANTRKEKATKLDGLNILASDSLSSDWNKNKMASTKKSNSIFRTTKQFPTKKPPSHESSISVERIHKSNGRADKTGGTPSTKHAFGEKESLAGGWTRGKGGWVRSAACNSPFSLSITRHK